ncbi:MAG: DNA-binding protein YbiB [Burkholderiaceae bacterium]|nr:DNA-binding protein YbiB [Burkholderiaceae bacterium]
MSIAPYIKEIGRGKEGARSLTSEQAHDLMSQVLDGRVSDLEVGAFAMAMRIKGESVDELCGFFSAVQERCIPLSPGLPAVILPSYNGARKLPNLTALLALLLAQEGTPVLVHGPANDPGRITTASIFRDLGLPTAKDARDVRNAWVRREPVFMTTETLCPPLARLLDIRRVIGLRNPGHTVAKLLDPTLGTRALRVVNHTHPEYGAALTAFLQRSCANAMLLRGTEGEPVADPRRLPRLDVFLQGELRADLSVAAQEGVLTELPVLPRSIDAATTAVYIQSVVSGEKPAPGPLARQVDCIRNTLQTLAKVPVHELIA